MYKDYTHMCIHITFILSRTHTHMQDADITMNEGRKDEQRDRRSLLVFELVGEPVETLVQSVTTCCACCLYVPVTMTQRVQAQFVCNLSGIHSIWQVLKQ